MMALVIIFWLSLFSVLYAYIGYVGVLWFMTLIKANPIKKEAIAPRVSLVISAYNEEKVLAQKIQNSLELDYPRHLLQIAVISDGSTDRTNDIIRDYADRDPRILPCIVARNQGKDSCLNDFVPMLDGEIILFSDANSFYEKDLVRKIVQPFADHRVGLTTGSTVYEAPVGSSAVRDANLYATLERITKRLESRIGSCVGADGAVFAMRKSLFSKFPGNELNDIAIPLQVVEKRYRVILEEAVLCREEAVREAGSEFSRQARIACITLRVLFNHGALLNPLRFPLFSFQVFSHKFMKYLCPFFLLSAFAVNALLAWSGLRFYQAIFILQILFYPMALVCGNQRSSGFIVRLVSLARGFILVQAAYLTGWWRFFKGEVYFSWKPNR
ncbi:MAG: glycosyltransferase [Desulfobacteraceae bacterium]|nr:MAG: glycosyltransferase [Desulfobacteraceae bacterium]